MPIYEYLCNKCNFYIEKLEKIDNNIQETCPNCKNNTLKKIISISNFSLKGKGWYKTDYKNNNK